MRGALDLFGLAGVLFVILVVGPYVQRFTEGYADLEKKIEETPLPPKPPAAQKAVQDNIQEKVKSLMMDLERLNKLLENPTVDPSTKEKIVKEKEDVQKEISQLTGPTLPSAEIKESFEGIMSADMEKNGKAADFLQKAIQSSPL